MSLVIYLWSFNLMLRLLVIASIGHRGHHRLLVEGSKLSKSISSMHLWYLSLEMSPSPNPPGQTIPTTARLSKINDKISILKESICDPHSFVWDIKVIMVAQYFDLANLAVVWHQKWFRQVIMQNISCLIFILMEANVFKVNLSPIWMYDCMN